MSLRRADQLVAEAVKLEILTLVVMTHIKRHKSLKLYRTNLWTSAAAIITPAIQ